MIQVANITASLLKTLNVTLTMSDSTTQTITLTDGIIVNNLQYACNGKIETISGRVCNIESVGRRGNGFDVISGVEYYITVDASTQFTSNMIKLSVNDIRGIIEEVNE